MRVAMLAATVVAATVGCSSQAPSEAPGSAVKRGTFSYTCCATADIDRVYHPGDVVTVHWIVEEGAPTSATKPTQVDLSARLTGPYGDVSSLKQRAATGAPAFSAAPIVTSDWAGGAPTSRLLIPANAAPGFYDLSTAAKSAGMTTGGGSIVRVVAPGHT